MVYNHNFADGDLVCLCDASRHGEEAAASQHIFGAAFEATITTERINNHPDNLGQIAEFINESVYRLLHPSEREDSDPNAQDNHSFFANALIYIDYTHRRIRHLISGLPSPFLRQSESTKALGNGFRQYKHRLIAESHAAPASVTPYTTVPSSSDISFQKDDSILLCSDGVHESISADTGLGEIQDHFQQCGGIGPDQYLALLRAYVHSRLGEDGKVHDDMTALCIRL